MFVVAEGTVGFLLVYFLMICLW